MCECVFVFACVILYYNYENIHFSIEDLLHCTLVFVCVCVYVCVHVLCRLDLSRGMPPESFADTPHIEKIGSAVFSRVFRPELLHTLKSQTSIGPLSADSLTGFGTGPAHDAKATANTKKFNQLARDATCYLLRTVIPEFATELVDNRSEIAIGRWAPELHQRGINVRHMGLCRLTLLPLENKANAKVEAEAKAEAKAKVEVALFV